jgi:murein L,D-transpeptidase YafK
MNPWSNYHLSFNLGYPNEFDQAHDRTGTALMVHGRCSSKGCFAMTDYYMDEIYTLADAALAGGQDQFQVHIFPFRLTSENLRSRRKSRWFEFWLNLKQGFDIFEKNRIPPRVDVVDGIYVFSDERHDSIVQHNVSATGQ